MQTIQFINNNTNFGMRYSKPEKWGTKTLKTFIESDLRKDIDKKYPNAKSFYSTKKKEDIGVMSVYNMNFKIRLDKNNVWICKDSAYSKEANDEFLAEKLQKLKLSDIERDINLKKQAEQERIDFINVARKSNENAFKAKLKNLISIFKK